MGDPRQTDGALPVRADASGDGSAADGAEVVWADGLRLRPSHHLVRSTLPISAAGVGILASAFTTGGEDAWIGVAIGLAFLVPGLLLLRAVRRSELVVSADGRLRVRLLREQPEIHLTHVTAIDRRFGIVRVTVDGDPFVGQETVTVPFSWWESENAVIEVLRGTARISGCAIDPAAALVLGIPARCPAGLKLPPRMPTGQAVVVLSVVAVTTTAVVVHLVSAVIR